MVAIFTARFSGVLGERSEPTPFRGVLRPRFVRPDFHGFWRAKRANPYLRDFYGRDLRPRFSAGFWCGRLVSCHILGGFPVGTAGGMRFWVVFRAQKQSADFGRFRCSSRALLRLRRFRFEIFAFAAGLLNGRFCFMPHFGCSCRRRSVFWRFRMRTHRRHGFGPFSVL